MDKEVKDRFDDINSYITNLGDQIKKGTVINIVVYSLLCILVLFYAIYIPSEVKKYTDAEKGPENIVLMVEAQLPADSEIIDQAKKAIPDLIRKNFDKLTARLPEAKQMFSDSMTVMTDELTTLMENESLPAFKKFIVEKSAEIKAEYPELTEKDAKEVFNKKVKEELGKALKKMVNIVNARLVVGKFRLNDYKKDDDELSNLLLAKKRIVVCFLKLVEDKDYKDNLRESLMQAVDKYMAVQN